MKTILSITSLMFLLAIFTTSCKKDSSNQDVLNANQKTEAQLQQSYQVAKQMMIYLKFMLQPEDILPTLTQ